MAPSEHVKNPQRVAAGLRASIKNPKVSDEAKAQATRQLQELESSESKSSSSSTRRTRKSSSSAAAEEVDPHVLGGYKATLHNPHTSETAKKHAREILNAAGIHDIDPENSEHAHHVLAGYKAALHNPKVSDEAKEHARSYLKDHGETN